jgi:hypothetical protein
MLEGRCINGCHDEIRELRPWHQGVGHYFHRRSHTPARCRIFKGHNIKSEDLVWRARVRSPTRIRRSGLHLIDAIRQNKPYNEVKRGVEASLVTSMGRMAAHTGQIITYEDMLNCDHEFAPDLDKLTASSPAPLQPGPDGKYPIPAPGINRKREY